MAAPFGGGVARMPLRQVIELFTAMGCTYHEIETRLSDGTVWTTRYLEDAAGDQFVPLADYDDDELVHPLVIESWERALDCPVPRPGSIN